MADNGWIKLHRCLLGKAIWKCSNNDQRVVLVTILMLANHEPNQWLWKGKKFECKAGQFITSYSSLAKTCDTTVKTVRNALAKFEKMEFLVTEGARTGLLVTIVNWELYQGDGHKKGTKKADEGQTMGTQGATNKNDKNDKNVRSNNKLTREQAHALVDEFGFNSIIQSSVDTWIDYKYERKDSYTPTGLNTLLGQIQKKVDLEGTDFVTDAIDNSISNTWKGIIWDAIKKGGKPQSRGYDWDNI